MDPRMMSQLLETYGFNKGAPISAANANAITQFGASNPDVLERRAMRMRGSGVDDNSDLLDAMLERVMAQTASGPPQELQPQAPTPPEPATEITIKNKPQAAKQNAGGSSRGFASEPNPSMASQASTAPSTALPPSGMTQSQTGTDMQIPGMGPAPPPPENEGGGILPLIMSILGIRPAGGMSPSAGGAAGAGGAAAITGPDMNAPRLAPPLRQLSPPVPQIESRVGPNMESVGQEMQTVDQRNQMQPSLESQRAGANANAATGDERLLDELIKSQNRDLLMRNAAKKAAGIGGRR